MNKTIIININGTVFHIEEDAYEMLKNYMTDVKRHFMNSADSLEITTDIENRIAEMLSEILTRDSKQAIVDADIQFVVEQMGRVEDFASADDDGTQEQPFFVETKSTSRKLFRDADERVVGGVCSGIASYFDIKSVWVRLAFVIAVLFFGTGFILYIILWLVVPTATTRADRMAMKGEKLNLQGFKRNFEEEMTGLKGSMSTFSDEARPFIYRARDFVGDFFTHFGSFLRSFGKALLKAIGIALVIGAFFVIIALIVIIIAFLAYGNKGIYNWFPFNIVNYEANVIFLICGFLLVGVPLLTIILLAVTVLFKNFTFTRTTGFTLLAIWFTSIFVVIYYSAKSYADFKEYGSFRKTVSIKPTSKATYYLKLNDIKYLTGEDSTRLNIKERFKGLTIVENPYNNHEMNGPGGTVYISIEKSDVATPVLVEKFSARGRTYEEALINARATNYQFLQQDSVLNFAPRLDRQQGSLWRYQELHLTLKVPLNSKLVIEEEMSRFINDIDIWGCKSMNGQTNGSTATFIMTADGIQCKADTIAQGTDATKKDSVIVTKDTTIITTKK